MDDPGSWNSQVSRNCTSSLSLHIIHMEFKMSLTIYILRVNLFIEKKSYPDFAFNGVTCKRLLTVYSEKKHRWAVLLDILQDYDYNENNTPLFVKSSCLYSLLIWIEYTNKGGVEKEEFRPLNLERLKCLKINPSEHGMLILLFWFMIFYVWCRFLWVQASVKRAVIIKESMPILDTRADFLQKDTILATQLSRKKRRRRVIENWIGFS